MAEFASRRVSTPIRTKLAYSNAQNHKGMIILLTFLIVSLDLLEIPAAHLANLHFRKTHLSVRFCLHCICMGESRPKRVEDAKSTMCAGEVS